MDGSERREPMRGEMAVMQRTTRRAMSLVVAVPCLLGAAYLAIDWADYGEDSTCGNLIRRAPWTGTCSEIMWHRVLGVIGLVVVAALVVLLAWLPRDTQDVARSPAIE